MLGRTLLDKGIVAQPAILILFSFFFLHKELISLDFQATVSMNTDAVYSVYWINIQPIRERKEPTLFWLKDRKPIDPFSSDRKVLKNERNVKTELNVLSYKRYSGFVFPVYDFEWDI